MSYLGTYVYPEDIDKIKNFKYSCVNHSLSYNYVISPACNWLVELMPRWWAPNVLTFLSLFFNVLATIYIYIESDSDLSAPSSRFSCFFFAFTHFLYIVLDNCDGKQARRTGTSSSLGLIIDHGCDSFTVLLVCFNLGHMTGLPVEDIILILIGFAFIFYNTTYEDYLLESMYFPIISGPDEGNVAALTVALLTGICGRDVWEIDVIVLAGEIYKLKHLTLYFVWFSCGCTTALFLYTAACHSINKVFRYLLDIQAFLLNVVLLVSHFLLLGKDHFRQYGNQLFMCFSLTFSRIAIQLMICCVSKRKFSMKTYKRIIFIMAGILLNQILLANGLTTEKTFYTIFDILLVALMIFVSDFVFGVLFTIRDGLGVKLLSIPYKKED